MPGFFKGKIAFGMAAPASFFFAASASFSPVFAVTDACNSAFFFSAATFSFFLHFSNRISCDNLLLQVSDLHVNAARCGVDFLDLRLHLRNVILVHNIDPHGRAQDEEHDSNGEAGVDARHRTSGRELLPHDGHEQRREVSARRDRKGQADQECDVLSLEQDAEQDRA